MESCIPHIRLLPAIAAMALVVPFACLGCHQTPEVFPPVPIGDQGARLGAVIAAAEPTSDAPPSTQQHTRTTPLGLPAMANVIVVRGKLPLVYQLPYETDFNVLADGQAIPLATLHGQRGDWVRVTQNVIAIGQVKHPQKLALDGRYAIELVRGSRNVMQNSITGPAVTPPDPGTQPTQ